jgi:hypothetical protein
MTLTLASPPLDGKERLVGKMKKEQSPPRSEHWANSEVFQFGSVAVAVMKLPEGIAIGRVTARLARQRLFVVTVAEPMNVSPSPKPVLVSNQSTSLADWENFRTHVTLHL